VDEHVWEEHCVGHAADPALGVPEVKPKQLCLLAFLPHILDSQAAGREAYLQILRGLTAKFKDRPFSYLWAEGGAQPGLEANFGVGGYGYPALVAYSPSKQKFSSLRSAFEERHVREFLDSVRQVGAAQTGDRCCSPLAPPARATFQPPTVLSHVCSQVLCCCYVPCKVSTSPLHLPLQSP
jgi:protein disulfide-isomerase A6